jgi:hypothetical protein
MRPGQPVFVRSEYAILPTPKSFAIVKLPRVISDQRGIAEEPACGA